MIRLQLRAGLAGTLLATALADGAALSLASMGSSSPDAEANIAKTAASLERLQTSPKTAPAARALNELSLKWNDCMMDSNEVVRTVGSGIECQSDTLLPPTPPCEELRLHVSNQVDVRSEAGLTCGTPEMERGPEPFGVRAS